MSIGVVIAAVGLFVSAAAFAGEAPLPIGMSVSLSEQAQTNGYPLATRGDGFRLGIPGSAFKVQKHIHASVARVPDYLVSLEGEELLSSLYRFDITAKKLEQQSPIWISIKRKKKSDSGSVVKYWNRDHWEEVASSWNRKEQRRHASVFTSSAIVGVFKKTEPTVPMHVGQASWYDWHGAAMNVYPMGTTVIVTNIATGVSTETTIVSTGPFVPGRIIDLPREVFAKLAPPSTGVITVSVTEKK